jgi:DNA-binding winged helix-turn-helix (wHTH) protein
MLLQPLEDDPRIELVVTKDLTPTWVSFAQRVAAGVMLLTTDDPLGALVHARTAGIDENLLLTVDEPHLGECREFENLGVTCVPLPLGTASRDRIVAVLKRTRSVASVEPTLRLLFDPIGRVVRYREKSMRLSQREFALLHCLAQHHGRPVRADQILNYVWEDAALSRSRQIVDVYVCQLRRKLERIGLGKTIRTLRGYGYTLQSASPLDRFPSTEAAPA